MIKKELLAKLKKPGTRALVFVVYPVTLVFVVLSVLCLKLELPSALEKVIFAGTGVFFFYSVYTLVAGGLRELGPRVAKLADRNRFTRRFAKDYVFRTFVFSWMAFAVNIAYVIFEGVMGIVYDSLWRNALAMYYLFLTLIRGIIIVKEYKSRRSGETEKDKLLRGIRTYGICGIDFIVLDGAMCGIVTMLTRGYAEVSYPGTLIYVVSAYTFYKIIAAVTNLVKARHSRSPVVQSLRNINLADALMSVISMETALIAEFGDGESLFVMRTVTGFIACVIPVALGAAMALRAFTEYRSVKNGGFPVRFGRDIEGADTIVYIRECAAGQSSACKNMSDGTCDDKRGAEGEDPACAAVSSVRNGVSSDRIIGG